MQNFISLAQQSPENVAFLLDLASRYKGEIKSGQQNKPILAGRTLAMIFAKPSLRTRVSFSVAMTQLGGTSLILRDDEVGLGKREPVKDVARVLSGMCDGIMARVFEHEHLLELAEYSAVPVINGLSDYSHPCQAMADLLTLRERFGELRGRTLTYIGDGNNVARSLAVGCAKVGMRFVCCTPASYALPSDDMDRIMTQVPEMNFEASHDPADAVREADCVYTDTWVSMGQEDEKARRIADFRGFSIDDALMAEAPSHAVVLHCLPAYRGLEISESVMESPRSLIFEQAENRLHAQKAILANLLGGVTS